jgi:hypothetical protein
MYKISETTDGKFVGTVVESIELGKSIVLGDFIFEIDSVKIMGNIIILSNANYVIILKKEI